MLDKKDRKRLRKRSSISSVRGSVAKRAVILDDNVRFTGSTETERKSTAKNSLTVTGFWKEFGRNIEQREFIAVNNSGKAETKADTCPCSSPDKSPEGGKPPP